MGNAGVILPLADIVSIIMDVTAIPVAVTVVTIINGQITLNGWLTIFSAN